MADFGSYRHGILFHHALCPLHSRRRRRRQRNTGDSSGISICRAACDLVRSGAIDDQNPLWLDRGRRDPIRDCRRTRWRDLQAQLARDQLDLNFRLKFMKRFTLAFIAAYVFIFVWGWLLNGVLLKDVYAQTPNLWRSQNEMMS